MYTLSSLSMVRLNGTTCVTARKFQLLELKGKRKHWAFLYKNVVYCLFQLPVEAGFYNNNYASIQKNFVNIRIKFLNLRDTFLNYFLSYDMF